MASAEMFQFVKGSIRSVWALELLLLLRSRRDRAWTADQLVTELRASTPLVVQVLQTFNQAGLVREIDPGRFEYAPASPTLEACCEELESAYRERPVTVINAIVAPSDDLKIFADAFRFRGGGK